MKIIFVYGETKNNTSVHIYVCIEIEKKNMRFNIITNLENNIYNICFGVGTLEGDVIFRLVCWRLAVVAVRSIRWECAVEINSAPNEI